MRLDRVRLRLASPLVFVTCLVACGERGPAAPAGSGVAQSRPAERAAAVRPTVLERPEGEWPQWRGPERSGVSSETGLLPAWPAGGPPLIWKATNLGSGFSSLAISAGRAYTMGARDGGEWVIALDIADGTELWARRIGEEYDNSRGGGPRATPTVVGDVLYTLGANGDLVCLATADGQPRWQVNVLERFGADNLKWGLSESPLVEGDLVIVLTGSEDGSVVAFDRGSGEAIWQSAGLDDPPGYASALAVTVGDVRQILHFTDRAAVGVRLADGKPLWRNESAANPTANCTTPLFRDGQAFFTSAYDTGAALLRLEPDGAGGTAAREVYFTRDMMNHHGGVVLVGDHVYGFSKEILTCLDFATGKTVWRDRSVGKGSLVAADGMLYLFSEKGVVGLARATPDGYDEVSRFEIEPRDGPTWAHPVVVGKRLYLRNGDELSCYDLTPRT